MVTLNDMPVTMPFEPPREFDSEHFAWNQEVRVALPQSYAFTDRKYPVLWVTDPSFVFEHTAATVTHLAIDGVIPEMIVVGVGSPRSVTMAEFTERRMAEFGPTEDWSYPGMVDGFDLMRAAPPGQGAQFRDLLIDEIRPALAADYRMDPDEHTLFGHSAGGVFTAFTMLSRTAAFNRYIVSSPPANACDFWLFKAEEKYAAEHTDLPVRVFACLAEQEIFERPVADVNLFVSTAQFVHALHSRGYPSLSLDFKVFSGEGHGAVRDILLHHALPALWPGFVPDPSSSPVPVPTSVGLAPA